MASPATTIMTNTTVPNLSSISDYTNPKLLLTALLILLILIVLRPKTPLSHLPGPFLSNYTTIPLKIAILSGNRTLYIHALHETYGPAIRISPSEAAIASLPSFKLIHRVGASGFRKSDWYQKFVDSEGAPGLFAETDVKKHGARRRLFAGSFSKTSILGFEERVRGKVEMGVRKMKREGRTDVLKWWTFVATDAVADLSFGRSFGMLEKEEVRLRSFLFFCVRVRLFHGVFALPIGTLACFSAWTEPLLIRSLLHRKTPTSTISKP